jgi:hypothetical protein
MYDPEIFVGAISPGHAAGATVRLLGMVILLRRNARCDRGRDDR